MRKIFKLILSICLLFMFWDFSVTAEIDVAKQGACGNNVMWELDEAGTLTISGSGKISNYSLVFSNDAIYETTSPWYEYAEDIKQIIIKEGVTSIGAYSFANCNSVESVLISNTVSEIGCYAFASFYIGEDIGPSQENSLISVSLPDSITSIKEYAFYGCDKLKEIHIPENLERIAPYTFAYCHSACFSALPENISSIGDYAFNECYNLEEVVISKTVSNIGNYAFRECCDLKSVYISGNVETIGADVFFRCSTLEEVVLEEGLKEISKYMFEECTSLKELVIPETVVSIGSGAWEDCTALEAVSLPGKVDYWGDGIFNGCQNLKKVTVPKGATTIGYRTFKNCANLNEVLIPETITSIGAEAFMGCSSLKNLDVPVSVSSIGYKAFKDCTNLISIVIPEGVMEIQRETFENCVNLENVELSESIEVIENKAFMNCESLNDLYLSKNITRLGYAAFSGCKSFTNIEILGEIDKVENLLFANCENLINVSLPETVTCIWNSAFSNCLKLKSIIIPDGVTSIKYKAFYNCKSLEEVQVPNAVSEICEQAFNGCVSLKTVTLPKNLSVIGYRAFYGCKELKSVNISDIDAWTQISFGSQTACPMYYNAKLYLNEKVVEELSFSTEVKSISKWAFCGCNSITTVVFPESLKDIGKQVFLKCDNLTCLDFEGESPEIDERAFEGISANAYYSPEYFDGWEQTVKNTYGGNITWILKLDSLDTPVVEISKKASTGKPKLNWKAVDCATEYRVYRATSENGYYKHIFTTTGTSYLNTSAEAGTKYYYKVIAVSSVANIKSSYSNIVSVTTACESPTVKIYTNQKTGKPVLKWNEIDGAIKYKVYRSSSKSGEYKLVFTTKNITYTNTSAVAGKTYYYKVKAVCSVTDGNSSYSNVVKKLCILKRPTVTISLNKNKKPALKWERVPGAIGYYVYRATKLDGEYKLVRVTDSLSYINTSAVVGKRYYYKVVAVFSDEEVNSYSSKVVWIN